LEERADASTAAAVVTINAGISDVKAATDSNAISIGDLQSAIGTLSEDHFVLFGIQILLY
jgi:hypothetical protein